MTTAIAFQANRNVGVAGSMVFAADENIGGTVYAITVPTLVQNSTLTVNVSKVQQLSFDLAQKSLITVSKFTTWAGKSLTQASLLEVYTATSLNGELGLLSQHSTLSVSKVIQLTRALTQSSLLTVARQFLSGSAHSTYFITVNLAQNSQLQVQKGIQTVKQLTQASTLTMTKQVNKSFALVQASTLTVSLGRIRAYLTFALTTTSTLSVGIVKWTVQKFGGFISSIGRMMGR